MMELYKKDANGSIRVWSIEMESDGLAMEYGKQDGAMIEEWESIYEGKAGRTLDEQIESRYNSRINKKLDAGYVDSIDKIGERSKNLLGFEKPMLAKKLREVSIDFTNPVFVQRKYDGHRCLVTNEGGELTAYSRNGKVINAIGHILELLNIPEGMTIDGELYIHGVSLQKLGSLIRKNQVGSLDLNYFVYDVMINEPYSERLERLNNLALPSMVVVAPAFKVLSQEVIQLHFDAFRADGYEGAIIRHGIIGYEYGKRSKNLVKLKGVEDDEFLIIDIIPSKDGWARLVCEAANGLEFKMSAPGSFKEKHEVMKNKSNYIGKEVRAEYAMFTDEGKPFQPIAIMFRDKGNE